MDSRELAEGSGVSRPDEVALGAVASSNEAIVTPAREENSGLHEIKALASTTKRRISQRVTSEAEAEESLLVGASSGSFRAAAALPDPAREAAGEAASVRIGRPVVARPASEVDRRPLPARSSSAPFWVLGGVATAAAAAAVAVFVFGVGRENKKSDEVATAASSGEELAAAGTSAAAAGDRAAAVGSAAPADMKFAEPPPAAPGAAPAASAPATIALADPEQAKAEEDQSPAEGGAPVGLTGRSDGKGDSAADKGAPAREKKKVDASKQSEKEARKSAPTGKQSPGGGKDLNDVLDEVTGGVQSPTAPAPEEAPKKPSKKGLDRADVAKAMGAVRSQVMRCRDKEQYEGTVTVKFHVAPSGKVTSAEATGSKAGTPTGACVAAAVKKAAFPPFDGAPTSFTYPFLLAE
ncbi:MAG TPA: energy transducer TonB [Kofleriaceae bacterium]|nr:energy transducer TonB [Kofleriaceae bacterium]